MKRLILMRHAKSDWSSGPSSDHDRPLNPRGRRAAAALGDWLRAQNLVPDEVLCSSAMRTRETCLRLGLPEDIDLQETRELYLASAEQILNAVKTATGNCVLVIGHNPGIGMAAERCVTAKPDHPQFQQYPTGATLVVEFDVDQWRALGVGKGNARHFVVPREL